MTLNAEVVSSSPSASNYHDLHTAMEDTIGENYCKALAYTSCLRTGLHQLPCWPCAYGKIRCGSGHFMLDVVLHLKSYGSGHFMLAMIVHLLLQMNEWFIALNACCFMLFQRRIYGSLHLMLAMLVHLIPLLHAGHGCAPNCSDAYLVHCHDCAVLSSVPGHFILQCLCTLFHCLLHCGLMLW